MRWALLTQLPATSGLPSGTAFSPRPIIRQWIDRKFVTYSIWSLTERASSTRKDDTSNPKWNFCRRTRWVSLYQRRSSWALCHRQNSHRRSTLCMHSSGTPKSSVTTPLSRVRACMLCVLLISRVSCGYVGRSDGWTDLADNFQMDWEFDQASDENIALTGELNLTDCREVTLGLAFRRTEHQAITTLFQAVPVESVCSVSCLFMP